MFQYDYEITDDLLIVPDEAPPIRRQYAFTSLEELNFRELNLDEEIVFRSLDPLPEESEENGLQQTNEIISQIINLDNINEDYFSNPIFEQGSFENGDSLSDPIMEEQEYLRMLEKEDTHTDPLMVEQEYLRMLEKESKHDKHVINY